MGKLYIVPTPVGNMADMTPRAVEVLRTCDRIYAEDTRTSGVLLRHFDISTPCSSHHKFNEHTTVRPIIEQLMGGENVALISDAGTPGISDPGFLLTRECRREGIEVETLPGPTAFVPALVNSGLPTDRFTFEGFLPPKKGRQTRIDRIAASDCTSIVYESPLRLVKTLEQFAEACGRDRAASVSREISKLHNTTVNGTLGELVEYFGQNIPRGEIVIVIGAQESAGPKVHKNKYKDA
ncbi:16S rRNA (cytidine(1402)-2'-O)-methyltransferase [uncultured Duncaniella sp.]|uniref:16S rRNA (cytidine(1402)-2'-O)-methyltransferase n=1 Tax=uncultured Duncaniella sp. TaxID=2768039 RepID=UPI0025F42314|nr:16S rRNA (cytidine(1402)-2'-O)-methyltransferase [uncultured Duncaniella sp.]